MQAYAAQNYSDPHDPYYSGMYAVETTASVETLTVITYNIWFAENIDQALFELQQFQSQKGLDIVLLQEMDEVGVERIAQQLRLNYVYFPAAVEPTYDKNFGNAILSSWPIVDAQKLILPHKSFSNRMNRIATRATVRIHGMDILVYSIHTESIFTLPRFREDQYSAVVKNIDPETRYVIVGGDFNSFTQSDIEEVDAIYSRAGLVRVSEGSGHTIDRYGIEIASDHVFAKGFTVQETGTFAGATASDHLPLWVTLIPE